MGRGTDGGTLKTGDGKWIRDGNWGRNGDGKWDRDGHRDWDGRGHWGHHGRWRHGHCDSDGLFVVSLGWGFWCNPWYGLFAPSYCFGLPAYYGAYYSPTYYDPIFYWDPGVGVEVIPATPAYLEVIVPDAEGSVWLEGAETIPMGKERFFVTPTLEPGKRYSYVVTAVWSHNGQVVKEERKVYVAPGRTSVVDFTDGEPQVAR